MALTLQGILQAHYASFARRHRLPRHVRDAAQALALCRTAAKGAHVRYCPQGHLTGCWYNSCRHRSCPQCAFLDVVRWLESRMQWLLPCSHYHVVFTLPNDLHQLWRYNVKSMTELLFESVRWCLFEMLTDRKHLGAVPGVLAVLHTWGRTLSLHPHVHCLVTAGGRAPEGWRSCPRNILVPCRPLGLLFRGYFLRRLSRLLADGALRLPPDMTEIDASWALTQASRKKWTPRIQQRYDHARGVMLYLARYVRGGPFRNRSLVATSDREVTFRYRNWRQLDDDDRAQTALLTLSVDEFLRRLLSHVPKRHTRTVRGWGLYAHTSRTALEQCRAELGGGSLDAIDEAALDRARTAPATYPIFCPECGRRLVVRSLPHRGKPPPNQPPLA